MMLAFRYTCARHQRMFIEAAEHAGCGVGRLNEIKQKTLAWLSRHFPRAVLEHYNEACCLGCKLEGNGIDLREVERVVAELTKGPTS